MPQSIISRLQSSIDKPIYALSAAHFVCDAYSSMLGVFLPLLVAKFDLTLSQAGILAGVLLFSSSMTQPLYGLVADRIRRNVFIVLGPSVTAVFISSLGVAPGYWGLVVFLLLGGAGIAAFHPQGASLAGAPTSRRRGLNMSVFVTGGNIGYALGPIYIMSVIALFGLERSFIAALPALIIALFLVRLAPQPIVTAPKPRDLKGDLRATLRPLVVLYFLVVVRSAVQIVFVTFLPTYFQFRGHSFSYGSGLLTAYLLFGAFGGFLGGPLADRFGGKRVIACSMLFSVPLLLGFLLSSGWLSTLLLVSGGMVLLFTVPINVVMAQELVPRGASTIAALMMGFAWGMGGAAVPLVGWAADHFGLQRALMATVLVPLAGLLLATFLPERLAEVAGEPLPGEPVRGEPVEMILE